MASIRKRNTNKGIKYTVLYDFTDKNGKRKQRSAGTFDRKQDAELLLSDIESKKRKNCFIVPSDETTTEFIRRWLPIRTASKKMGSELFGNRNLFARKACYTRNRRHADSQGHTNAHRSTVREPSKETAQFSQQEETGIGSPVPFTIHINRYLHIGQMFFDAATLWKIIDENPVKIDKPKADEYEVAFWEPDMIKLALENMSDERLRLMVHIASAHTCRNGEVCGLTWDSVDFEKGVLLIGKTLQRVKKREFEQLPPKEVFGYFRTKSTIQNPY
jgi:integrase